MMKTCRMIALVKSINENPMKSKAAHKFVLTKLIEFYSFNGKLPFNDKSHWSLKIFVFFFCNFSPDAYACTLQIYLHIFFAHKHAHTVELVTNMISQDSQVDGNVERAKNRHRITTMAG